MQLNPTHRPDLEGVYSHPWMKGSTPSQSDILSEFNNRQIAMDKQVEAEKEERRNDRRKEKDRRNVARGDGDNQEILNLFKELYIS